MYQVTDDRLDRARTSEQACCQAWPEGVSDVAAAQAVPDEALLHRVACHGDHSAFEAVYARHAAAVKAAAGGVCSNRATVEDIVQQTFMALWHRAPRLAAKTVRLRPWLLTVARNAAIDSIRASRAATVPLEEAAGVQSPEIGPEEALFEGEARAVLQAGLAALSRHQRAAVELVYFEGLTYQAVADATGEPLGTVKSRVRLALRHLRESMADQVQHGW